MTKCITSTAFTTDWPHLVALSTFLPRLAGGEAASQVGPKIVLDHMHVSHLEPAPLVIDEHFVSINICLCTLGFLTIGCIRYY